MRLIATAVMTTLRPGTRHAIYPPKALVPLAKLLFSDLVDVDLEGDVDIEMTHLGLRHILPTALLGKSYYLPFYWLQRLRRPKNTVKDVLNDIAMQIAVKTRIVAVPERRHTFLYQGYMEMQGISPSFQSVEWDEFQAGAAGTLEELGKRLRLAFPATNDVGNQPRDVVFPSGTAHQIMPPEFAQSFFPDARFCFHREDPLAREYAARNLDLSYFDTPEGIVEHIAQARRTFCTDSFPSHVAQVWQTHCYLLMTQQITRMVVVPGFPEDRVVRSLAPCHPCRSRARYNDQSLCDAGRVYCHTWNSEDYIVSVEDIGRAGID